MTADIVLLSIAGLIVFIENGNAVVLYLHDLLVPEIAELLQFEVTKSLML